MKGRLVWTTLVPLAIVALTALESKSACATTVSISCPASPPLAGHTFVSEVTIDTGLIPLGAYTIAIEYDPSVVTIASIAGGSTLEFSGAPTTKPSSFTSGTTRISAFNTTSLTSPTGLVSVARVTFNFVGQRGAASALGLIAT